MLVVIVVGIAASAMVVGGLAIPFTQADSGTPDPATEVDPAEPTEPDVGTNDRIEEDTEEMHIRVHGSTIPGDTLNIEATNGEDEPIENAEVIMNGEEIDMTDEDGHAEITVPHEEELDLEVHAGGAETEVQIGVNQQAANADADVESEIDIEFADGGSQSTSVSTSTDTSTSTSTSTSTNTSTSTSTSTSTTSQSESTTSSNSSVEITTTLDGSAN